MNDNTKKVYEIDDVETMKGFLERTYEKVQELRNELSKDCDPNTDSRIRSKWRKIEKSIDDMGNVASRVAFDDILLLNGISATKGEGIRALLNSSLSPMKIENEGFTALVLPVRMKNRA